MKKIFLLFALVAFVGTATVTPVVAAENAIVFCDKCSDKDKKCSKKDKKACAKAGKEGKKGCCAAKAAKGKDAEKTTPAKVEGEKVDEVK